MLCKRCSVTVKTLMCYREKDQILFAIAVHIIAYSTVLSGMLIMVADLQKNQKR